VPYCGEEDLLGHYLINYDQEIKRHIIGSKTDDVSFVGIGEGEWYDFIGTSLYENTKKKNKISYFWDELIQRTCQNALDGIIGGNSDMLRGQNAIFEMVKEPRFFRRALAEKIMQAVSNFPDHPEQMTRQVTYLPSHIPDVGYVFFQLRVPKAYGKQADYREKRQKLLEIACGAAKNKLPHLSKVVGIGMDAPKYAEAINSGEDFILLPCEIWPEDMRSYYEGENKIWEFFATSQLTEYKELVTQFVPISSVTEGTKRINSKPGRNDLCPCGSGKKYKKCHGSG
jgi:hypothetical protein